MRERTVRIDRWVAALAVGALSTTPLVAHGDEGVRAPARPFAVVVDDVVRGDLVVAANSNLLSAGGWSTAPGTVADVDDDGSLLCVPRSGTDPACADNSSSARLDLPPGSRVIEARLYVESSLSASAGRLNVRLDGPGKGHDYTLLGGQTPGVPKRYEASTAMSASAVLRQTVWDVTGYVAAAGAGRYTVADIVSERAGPFLPYASWAIVAAYELDPAIDVGALAPLVQPRFARRAIVWHDGFVLASDGAGEVDVADLALVPGQATFAKSLHIVAAARRGAADNLLFNGRPLGNNRTPGDRPPPPGVSIGRDRSCNSTTDVFNETICVLGAPVNTKRPGPTRYVASSNGTSVSSGSAVDVDVLRVPDRYLVAGSRSARLSVIAADGPIAIGMLGVAVDLAGAAS
jgi:hypothetical protein